MNEPTDDDFDLATLETRKRAEEGVELQLHSHIDGMPLPVWLCLYGVESRPWRDALLQVMRERRTLLEAEQRGERTPDEIEADATRLLSAATKSWRGVRLDGAVLDCTPANALLLYERFPWIRQQADAFVQDRANFLPGSASN